MKKKKDLLDYVTAIKKNNNNKISQFHFVNPFSPKSDQHQISPCNINTLQNRVVMRITDMITQDEFA